MMTKYLIIFILITSQSYAQEAPKKANTIYVASSDDMAEVFPKFEQYLDDEGFIIRSKKDLISLKTSPKEKTVGPMSSYSVYIEFLLMFKQLDGKSVVTITGEYADAGGLAKSKPISNRGNSRMGIGLAWQIMNELAIRYPGGKLSYSIE